MVTRTFSKTQHKWVGVCVCALTIKPKHFFLSSSNHSLNSLTLSRRFLETKMGEEEKKQPSSEAEAKKSKMPQEDKKSDEKKTKESKPAETPPPPPEIVLKIFMHCEGCARKIKKCLKGFDGVEDVETDCKTHKVTVKGKNADPIKVLERVQKKSGRKVELLSPIPKPPSPEDAKKAEEKKDEVKPEEKKAESKAITVMLKVHMHCEGCAQEIRSRIMRMKGVEAAEPDLMSSQVAVKGVFDPAKLAEFVYKRTGKHAQIVKTEAEKKKEEDNKGKEEKKEGEDAKPVEEKKEGEEAKPVEGGAQVDMYYYYPPKSSMEYFAYSPQIFSDENPNACAVM